MSVNQPANKSVHTLLVPTSNITLLIPSAIVAEVITVSNLFPQPASPEWCAGLASWRNRAIPVISIEALAGKSYVPPGPRSKFVVFFPLPGCHESQFFAVQSLSEPQPNNISETKDIMVDTPKLPIAAAALNMGSAIGVIPDLEYLKNLLYPSA